MELSASRIEDHTFTTALRGYDKEAVRTYLAAVAGHVSSLEERISIAEAKAARAQEALDSLKDEIEQHLEDAQNARQSIIDAAKREAREITEAAKLAAGSQDSADAASASAAIIAEAERKATIRLAEVDAIVADAAERADAIVAEAESAAQRRMDEADRILDAAHRESRKIHTDSERYRSETEHRLRRVRALLAAAEDPTDRAAGVVVSDGNEIVVDLRAGAPQRDGSVESV